ncbi:hypothetical protein GUITHDRAFT_139792 [Guillardia theta CCMP2712]|uniref:Methyltransferase FkbM domain-containing protein n=1 Tax=Guillardia theta (strain CCMP2712) TaxID=905079 RepID=L1J7Z8_GUITC|nr:hypothetical protein GUITHDRAFT_139792 [Guillardia theta CCMP2712]EKX44224.1 hypothetical protein GUITHDRAFT_139792 [Guillardia theta CCMP2712]|eukprot:XP_005831204.1 hypothetical protein GUITHDRAFT_139792 [Guillardia theta CCMP2712]
MAGQQLDRDSPSSARCVPIHNSSLLSKEHPRGEGSIPGERCSEERIRAITKTKPHLNSFCPLNERWIDALLEETAHLPSATLLSIGCNKGEDLIYWMHSWSRNDKFWVPKYRTCEQEEFPTYVRRKCGQARQRRFLQAGMAERSVRGVCVEPMPNNFRLLQTCMGKLGFLGEVNLVNVAVSSSIGTERFPHGQVGEETLGLEVHPVDVPTVAMNVTTLDSLVRQQNISSIEFLSIDTEGNDMRAVLGGIRALGAQMVRYMEFEYHYVGRWRRSDLQDLIDLLDQMNYDCFWALNTGGLSRLTGCWHDSYYREKDWSNVACINRNQRVTHRKMQRLAGF